MVAFASRRPDLRLNLQPTDTDEAQFAAGLQKRIEKQQVANDAQYLPKSTNMNLPNHISTGVKYNFEEGEDDSGSGTTAMGNANANGNGSMAQGQGSVKSPIKSHSRNASTAAAATFKRCIPCFFVSHIPTTLPWYKDVLGFQLRGKAESARAELFRSAPGVNRGSDGVSLYLRKVPSPSPSAAASEGRHSSRDPSDAQQAPVPKGSLWIEVDDVDGECEPRTLDGGL